MQVVFRTQIHYLQASTKLRMHGRLNQEPRCPVPQTKLYGRESLRLELSVQSILD